MDYKYKIFIGFISIKKRYVVFLKNKINKEFIVKFGYYSVIKKVCKILMFILIIC